MAEMREIGALLSLLTCAAWSREMPAPMTRKMVYDLIAYGALKGGRIEHVTEIRSDLLDRASALMGRLDQATELVQRYAERGYDVLLPSDREWPLGINRIPVSRRPHFLFVKGNRALLSGKKVSVAGSREISRHTQALARRAGQMIASEGMTMVCGGAHGVDAAAQEGLLELGGSLIVIPAVQDTQLLEDDLMKSAYDDHRILIMIDALPDDSFSAARALLRNHAIYAMGDAALVIAARDGLGGTWNGASECLRRGYAPLYAANYPVTEDMAGCSALIKAGAKPLDLLRPLNGQIRLGGYLCQTDMFA